MRPKSGKAPSPVAPVAPAQAEDADVDDPGKVAEVKAEQVEKKEGKYGSTPVKPHKPPESTEEEEKTSWIEIELVGEDDIPIAGERFEVTMPDGSVASGSLDHKGLARIEGIEPGTCKVTFPDLDKEAWEKA